MKVSAYIPSFNNADTLPAAMESVRQQCVPPVERFVIDDGSTDGSPALARGLGWRVISNVQNLGRGAVRARAMLEAQNEFVLACDANVALPVDFLERAGAWFKDEEVAAVMGRVGQTDFRTAPARWRARHLFKMEAPCAVSEHASLATGAVLLRRSLVLRAGNFDAQCRHSEDADLGQRLLAAGCKVVFDPALQFHDLSRNTLGQILERYWRWNAATMGRMNFRNFIRQLAYACKVMAREDLRKGDFGAAMISLLCPSYLLWKSNVHRPARQ